MLYIAHILQYLAFESAFRRYTARAHYVGRMLQLHGVCTYVVVSFQKKHSFILAPVEFVVSKTSGYPEVEQETICLNCKLFLLGKALIQVSTCLAKLCGCLLRVDLATKRSVRKQEALLSARRKPLMLKRRK